MPTKAGLATLVSGVASLALGRVFGIFEFYIIGVAMIALVGCALAWVLLNWRSIGVSREVRPSRLHVGSVSTVTLTLRNERMFPTPVAQITDAVQGVRRADANVPPLRRNRSTRASYGVPAKVRGLVEIGPMKTRVTDSFGLASVIRTSAPDASVLVLPWLDDIEPPPQPGGDIAMLPDRSPGRVGTSGEEFSALRAYSVGDDLRKVHWPSTARTGDLMVRTEHVPEHGRSIVLLDVRSIAADPETFERMVSAAASILAACRRRDDTVRLGATDGSECIADDDASFARLLDHLALIQQTDDEDPHLALSHTGMGGETAVLVVAAKSESLLAAMYGGAQHGRTTIAIRFEAEGANPPAGIPQLRSIRMVDIAGGEEFAENWGREFRPPRRSRS